jgi:tetratricopeptide (TPR) repeat protein
MWLHRSITWALVYQTQGRYAEAEPLYERSLAIREKALGPEHPDVGGSLNNLATLRTRQGRSFEAQHLHQRTLAILEKALGTEHPDVGRSLDNLAWLAYAKNDWSGAAAFWRRSTTITRRSSERDFAITRGEPSEEDKGTLASQFWGLVKATHRMVTEGLKPLAASTTETFEAAQWAQGSKAATSLAQMAASSAKGSPRLGGLVRER